MLINENQACLKLGITKELLYAFVKVGAKGKKLIVYTKKNNKFFDENELRRYDKFLKKPWSNLTLPKPIIPKHIREYLKVECGGKCARCGSGHRLDNAHIIPWNQSLSHHPHNLIRLCTDCHVKYDDGIISKKEILSIKDRLTQKVKTDISQSEIDNFKVFFTPPLPDKYFIGRKNEIIKTRKVYKENRLTVIQGIGGIGKTQLLIHVLNKVKSHWFNVEHYNNLFEFKIGFLDRFKVQRFEDFLRNFDKSKNILVLDGLETLLFKEWDNTVDFIQQLFQGSQNFKIIITSQVDFSNTNLNYSRIFLSGLSYKDSLNCLAKFLGTIDKADSNIRELINFCDGHPLTLRIIAGLILFYRKSEFVVENVKKFGIEFIKDAKRKKHVKATSLEVCLELAYSRLAKPQTYLLEYLSHFPGGFKEKFLEAIILDKKVNKMKSIQQLNYSISLLHQFQFIKYEIDYIGLDRIFVIKPLKTLIKKYAKRDLRQMHDIQVAAFGNLAIEAVVVYSKYMYTQQALYALK